MGQDILSALLKDFWRLLDFCWTLFILFPSHSSAGFWLKFYYKHTGAESEFSVAVWAVSNTVGSQCVDKATWSNRIWHVIIRGHANMPFYCVLYKPLKFQAVFKGVCIQFRVKTWLWWRQQYFVADWNGSKKASSFLKIQWWLVRYLQINWSWLGELREEEYVRMQ